MSSENKFGNISSTDLSHLTGKYLTFALSSEQYGASILDVYEIFGMKPITRVPRAPQYIKGVINLRGRIIPIVDLRTKFGLPEIAHTEKTCIVVVNVAVNNTSVVVGMIVDTVLEVRDFNVESLAVAPDYGCGINTKFVIGMGKHADGNVTILIDINKIFESNELDKFAQDNTTQSNSVSSSS